MGNGDLNLNSFDTKQLYVSNLKCPFSPRESAHGHGVPVRGEQAGAAGARAPGEAPPPDGGAAGAGEAGEGAEGGGGQEEEDGRRRRRRGGVPAADAPAAVVGLGVGGRRRPGPAGRGLRPRGPGAGDGARGGQLRPHQEGLLRGGAQAAAHHQEEEEGEMAKKHSTVLYVE